MAYAYLGVWVNDEDLFRVLSIFTCKTFSPWQAFLTVVYTTSLSYRYIFLYSDSR
jgi:hypothetical protein